jgi:hypothetical protein
MRIDASNLLVASQAQAQKPTAAKAAPQKMTFEPLDFAKPSAGASPEQTAPASAFSRPGSQLDMKV